MTGRPCECGEDQEVHVAGIGACMDWCECQRYTAPAAVEVERNGGERLPGFGEES